MIPHRPCKSIGEAAGVFKWELRQFENYVQLAHTWRDEVANVRLHKTTKERPVDRFAKERELLRPLPPHGFDTDEVVSLLVSSHARIHFDGNRYSVPPQLVGKQSWPVPTQRSYG